MEALDEQRGGDETTETDIAEQIRGAGGSEAEVARQLSQFRANRGRNDKVFEVRPDLILPLQLFRRFERQFRTAGLDGALYGFDYNVLYAWASAPGRRIDGDVMRWLERCFEVVERVTLDFAGKKRDEEVQKMKREGARK